MHNKNYMCVTNTLKLYIIYIYNIYIKFMTVQKLFLNLKKNPGEPGLCDNGWCISPCQFRQLG